MASNINPNSIDSSYPIAGQDNDSQGFRDNFTNIKSNFSYSRDEINDLQNNVLLKNGLQGSVLSADDHNQLDGTKLTGALMQDMREVVIAGGTSQAATEIDVSKGSYHTLDVVGDVALTFINFPADSLGSVITELNVIGSAELTFPAATSVIGMTKLEGYNAGNNSVILINGTYIYQFYSYTNGNILIVTPLVEEH